MILTMTLIILPAASFHASSWTSSAFSLWTHGDHAGHWIDSDRQISWLGPQHQLPSRGYTRPSTSPEKFQIKIKTSKLDFSQSEYLSVFRSFIICWIFGSERSLRKANVRPSICLSVSVCVAQACQEHSDNTQRIWIYLIVFDLIWQNRIRTIS